MPTKIRAIRGPAAYSLAESWSFPLVSGHARRVPPAHEEPTGRLLPDLRQSLSVPTAAPSRLPQRRPSLGRIWGVRAAPGSAWGESTTQPGTILKEHERRISAGQAPDQPHRRRSGPLARRLKDVVPPGPDPIQVPYWPAWRLASAIRSHLWQGPSPQIPPDPRSGPVTGQRTAGCLCPPSFYRSAGVILGSDASGAAGRQRRQRNLWDLNKEAA